VSALKDLKILVVDDCPENQFRFYHLLVKRGAQVAFASDGLEGADLALSGAYDIVLMDIEMPVMDGFEAMGKLKDSSYNRPVIALTAHSKAVTGEKMYSSGFAGHVTKPIEISELVETILSLAGPRS